MIGFRCNRCRKWRWFARSCKPCLEELAAAAELMQKFKETREKVMHDLERVIEQYARRIFDDTIAEVVNAPMDTLPNPLEIVKTNGEVN